MMYLHAEYKTFHNLISELLFRFPEKRKENLFSNRMRTCTFAVHYKTVSYITPEYSIIIKSFHFLAKRLVQNVRFCPTELIITRLL